jgi:metal-responsive CopG/Arc/MetJ family transcriptional regulator
MRSADRPPPKRRGPPPTEVGTLIGVRLRAELLSALDEVIAQEPDPKPSRAEMIRRILKPHLDEP